MQQKDKLARVLVVIAIVVATLSLSIAYATFSQILTIKGTATVKGSWSVFFTNLGSTPAINGSAESTSAEITSDTTTFNFAVTLKKPGDSVSYTLDVKNGGTIDAKLTKIELTGVSEAAAKNITYTVTYDDGTELAVGDSLPAAILGSDGTTITNESAIKKTIKVTVTYDKSASSTTSTDIDMTLDLGAALTYTQA